MKRTHQSKVLSMLSVKATIKNTDQHASQNRRKQGGTDDHYTTNKHA